MWCQPFVLGMGTNVHACDGPLATRNSVYRPRLRNAGRSLPKSHSRGPQANGGEAGAGFDVLSGPLDPVAPLPAFPYRPAVTRLTESLSFDSALLSRGAPSGARCVPTSSSHSTAPEPVLAKRCVVRFSALSRDRVAEILEQPKDTDPGARRGNHLPAFPWPKLFFAVVVPADFSGNEPFTEHQFCLPFGRKPERSAFARGTASQRRWIPASTGMTTGWWSCYGSSAVKPAASSSSMSPCAR